MKEIKIGRHEVVMYESISEMPIQRFHLYNKYILIDSGIGSDTDSVMLHAAKIRKYIDLGDKSNATIELNNMIQNMVFMLNGINPSLMSTAALIYSIDGKVMDDMSDSGLKKIVSIFDADVSFFKRILNAIKKKTTQRSQRTSLITTEGRRNISN